MNKSLESLLSERLSLRELLSIVDFDYGFDKETDSIYLIDKQGAYLGDIDKDRFENSEQGKKDIIERMTTYWDDSLINDIDEQLEHYGYNEQDYENLNSYEEYLDYIVSIYNPDNEIFFDDIVYLNNVVNPDMVIFNLICPHCEKELTKINIDYVASVNRSFNVTDNELYWCDFDDETSVDDMYMIYCSNCCSELPKEIRDEIAGWTQHY